MSAVPEAVCVPVPTTKVDERAPDMTEPVEVAEETRPREELMRQPEITSTDLDVQASNPTASNEQRGVRKNEGQSTEGKDHRPTTKTTTTTTITPSTTRRYPERTRRPPERFYGGRSVIYDCIIWTMRMRNDVYIFIYKCMLSDD